MLPILKRLKEAPVAGLIVKTRAPDEKPQDESDDHSAAIEACARDLITALHAKDVKGVASAICSAFEILDSLPHEEGEHTNASPHSYDAQNKLAGKEQE